MEIPQRVSELSSRHDFHTEITKEHNSINNVGDVTVFVFCKWSDHVSDLYQVSELLSGHDFHTKIYKGT